MSKINRKTHKITQHQLHLEWTLERKKNFNELERIKSSEFTFPMQTLAAWKLNTIFGNKLVMDTTNNNLTASNCPIQNAQDSLSWAVFNSHQSFLQLLRYWCTKHSDSPYKRAYDSSQSSPIFFWVMIADTKDLKSIYL